MKLSVGLLITFLLFALSMAGQTSGNNAASVSVPPVIQFANTVTEESGTPLSGTVPMTFLLYSNAKGGAPLWSETQNVAVDSSGHYNVYLGITQTNGIPSSLFTSGEAHWLGVKVEGQEEQPRVFLVSVPYAMKAGDAATVGGLPASAFVRATPNITNSAGSAPSAFGDNSAAPSVTGTGTEDYIPLWTNSSGALGDSILFQSGTTAIGINTTTPAATLDVNGGLIARGPLQLPSTGTATASGGFNSQPMEMTASAFNSGTGTAVPQNFQWQAEATNNDSSSASGTLNLLYATGSNPPKETGLNIGNGGLINFVTDQTFPGTVTGITAGTGITVTGSKASPTVSINVPFANEYYPQLAAANTFAKSQTVNGTMTATSFSGNGSGLTDVTAANSNELSGLASTAFAQLGASSNTFTGSLTASSFTGNGAGLTNVTATNSTELGGLAASAFAELAAANTFTGNQTVNGAVSASSYQIGGIPFAFGSAAVSALNAFLGFAGNTTTTGYNNTAAGYQALYSNTMGNYNTANGTDALYSNTTGSFNTASGDGAIYSNTMGSQNTASGYFALFINSTGSYNTAAGYTAMQNSNADYDSAFGYQAMYNNSSGGSNVAVGYNALYNNGDGNNNTAVGYSAGQTNATGSLNTFIGFQADASSGNLSNATGIGDYAVVGASNTLVLGSVYQATQIGMGVSTVASSHFLDTSVGAYLTMGGAWTKCL
jgi:hypothetical protein